MDELGKQLGEVWVMFVLVWPLIVLPIVIALVGLALEDWERNHRNG
jgi:hypothetical protein